MNKIKSSLNNQLGELNREISSLQTRLVNTEACISNMSQTQATLINRMAAKPELNTPAETDTFVTLKTLNTSVSTIHIDDNLKNKNGPECLITPKSRGSL